MRAWGLVLMVVGLVACKSSASPPGAGAAATPVNTAPPPPASGPVAPGVAATAIVPAAAGSAGRVIPPVEGACQRDEECALFNEDLTGATACCPGCTWHAGNKPSVRNFHTACNASPASMCPPIGCLMAATQPRCVSGRCEAVAVAR